MTNKSFALLPRGKEFSALIEGTICIDALGDELNLEQTFKQLTELFNHNKENGGAIYLIGNGGSAAVASHAATDFINVSRLRAFTLHDSALITCMANDFGYDQAFKRILNTVIKQNDLLIAISSSGQSTNICHAATIGKEKGAVIITLSGFHYGNPLCQLGHFNFWLNSNDYGLIEIGHLFLLHNLADRNREAVALKDREKLACLAASG